MEEVIRGEYCERREATIRGGDCGIRVGYCGERDTRRTVTGTVGMAKKLNEMSAATKNNTCNVFCIVECVVFCCRGWMYHCGITLHSVVFVFCCCF